MISVSEKVMLGQSICKMFLVNKKIIFCLSDSNFFREYRFSVSTFKNHRWSPQLNVSQCLTSAKVLTMIYAWELIASGGNRARIVASLSRFSGAFKSISIRAMASHRSRVRVIFCSFKHLEEKQCFCESNHQDDVKLRLNVFDLVPWVGSRVYSCYFIQYEMRKLLDSLHYVVSTIVDFENWTFSWKLFQCQYFRRNINSLSLGGNSKPFKLDVSKSDHTFPQFLLMWFCDLN